MTKIFDLTVETTEIQAVVTKTYEGSGNARGGGPKMNIEWIDLNEEVQSKGSIVSG